MFSQIYSVCKLSGRGNVVRVIFTCVSYAEARNRYRLDVRLSVRPSVLPSVTRWYCIKTAERIVMLSSPHNSPFILVFCVERSSQNSDGVTPCGAAKQRWGVKISQFSTNRLTGYISETVGDRWVHAVRRVTSIEFSFD